LLENILFFILAISVLVKSVNITINSLSNLAKSLNISEFIIATVFMGIASSLPELFVGINSAIKNVPQLSLGNIMGASILDITLVLGLPLIIAKNLNPKSKNLVKNIQNFLIILILPILLLLDGKFSRIEGVITLLAFAFYIYKILKQKRVKEVTTKIIPKKLIHHSIKSLVGIFLLILSSHFVVQNANIIAMSLSVPTALVGLFMVSIGTTLPEISFGIKAALSKHPGMAIGDAIGSLMANLLLVLGVTSIIRPITVELKTFLIAIIFLILSVLIFYYFIKYNKTLTLKHGVILTLIYALFVLVEFML
jgi:cation:H+ antiporter